MSMLDILMDVLRCAKEHNQYACVAVTIPGQKGLEYIINEPGSLENKIAYYRETYNADGTHKRCAEIRMVAAGCIGDVPPMLTDLIGETEDDN